MNVLDSGTRFFFLHLQKTAGTTLFHRLKHHFGADAVYPMPQYLDGFEAKLDVPLLQERFARHGEEIRVVAGHFPLCVTEMLDADFSVFTVLREPVERALSFLRKHRTLSPRFADSSLEEIYEERMYRETVVRNHMVRMLSLTREEMTDGALTEVSVTHSRLESAKRNLAERVDVMGIQEDFEAFCTVLSQRFGWNLGKPLVANRTRRADASAALRQRIAVDNAMDAELYDFAVDLWHERKRDRLSR